MGGEGGGGFGQDLAPVGEATDKAEDGFQLPNFEQFGQQKVNPHADKGNGGGQADQRQSSGGVKNKLVQQS